jgi:hypothetical protein
MSDEALYFDGPPEPERPVTAASTDVEVLRWFFHCPPVRKFAGFAINAGDLAQALRDLTIACRKYPGDADEVLKAFQWLLAVAGPPVTSHFLSRRTLSSFCPYVPNAGTRSMAVVWEQGLQRVVARLQYRKDEPVDIRFDVEEVTHD